MRRACRVSAGEKEVLSLAMEVEGEALLRILERVARNLRRILCGMKVDMDGHAVGRFEDEKM